MARDTPDPRLDFAASPEIRMVIARIGRTEDVTFSPDGRRLAIADFLADRIFFFTIRIDGNGAVRRIVVLDHAELASPHLLGPHGVIFLDNDHVLVCSRGGDISVFRVPAARSNGDEPVAQPLAKVSGKGLFAGVKSPGSAASYRLPDGRYRVLVCNNNWHMITAHVVSLGERVEIANEGVVIEHGLRIPDGISISPDHGWIAISNHVDGTILVFRNDATLTRTTPAAAVLRGIICPHGVRFSPDGERIFVADAASPYLHVFERGAGWAGDRDPAASVRLLDDETFYVGRYDAREGGIKGIDIDRSGSVLATTLKDNVIGFYDVKAVLDRTDAVDGVLMDELRRDRDRSLVREDGEIMRQRWALGYRLSRLPKWLRHRLGSLRYSVRMAAKLRRLRTQNLNSTDSFLDPSGPVVSLTSHGARVDLVYYTIESIALGRQRPSRVILWLGERAYADRPETLRRLEARGLEVRPSEDLGPHTKYFPFLAAESDLAAPLVTADDDVLYPPDWLEGLIAANRSDPASVHCYRAEQIGLSRKRLTPFGGWEACDNTRPSHFNFITGVSGVIYPPAQLQQLKRQGKAFLDCCLDNDDVWMTVNAIRAGIKVAQVRPRSMHYQTIPGSQEQHLSRYNVGAGGTQRDLLATCSAADLAVLERALSSER